MYYKSPEIAPLAQPANPLEATTGEATTGAGVAPTGGAPAGTVMPIEDLYVCMCGPRRCIDHTIPRKK